MGLLTATVEFLLPYAGPALSLCYPIYASVEAIESPLKEDDEQWLTYWVIYSFLSLFEVALEQILDMIPIWPLLKFILVGWLVLPQFRGACYLYRTYVRQLFRKLPMRQHHLDYEEHDEYNEHQKAVLRSMSAEAREAVSLYISEYGAHSFDKLINSACRQSNRNWSPKTPKSSQKSPIRLLFERKSPKSSSPGSSH